MNRLLLYIFSLLLCTTFYACSVSPNLTIEQSVTFNKNTWNIENQPWIIINITDSSKPYNIFAVIRHENDFKFNNLIVNYSFISPGDSAIERKISLPLGNKKQWNGDTVGTIIETRVKLTPTPIHLTLGTNSFAFQQNMPTSSLKNILSIGIRIEKIN